MARRLKEYEGNQLKLERALEIRVGSGAGGVLGCLVSWGVSWGVSLGLTAKVPCPQPGPCVLVSTSSLGLALLALLALLTLLRPPPPPPPQDGQLASFMAVAHRQIKFLEDQVKELQKVAL
jgi:hypothetical protein